MILLFFILFKDIILLLIEFQEFFLHQFVYLQFTLFYNYFSFFDCKKDDYKIYKDPSQCFEFLFQVLFLWSLAFYLDCLVPLPCIPNNK